MAMTGIYTLVNPDDKSFVDTFKQSLCYERYVDGDFSNEELAYIEFGILIIEIVPAYDAKTDSYSSYELYFGTRNSVDEVSNYVFDSSICMGHEDFLEEVRNLDNFMEYHDEVYIYWLF